MGSFALYLAWLESTFHVLILWLLFSAPALVNTAELAVKFVVMTAFVNKSYRRLRSITQTGIEPRLADT